MEFRPTPKLLIKAPVKCYYGGIWDSDGFHVCDIRGWGRLQYFEKGEELQDKMGDWVAEAINEKLKNNPI